VPQPVIIMRSHHHTTIACLLVWMTASLANVQASKLYVFYPTTVRPQVLQSAIADACPGVEVAVFGRYSDFIAQIQLDPPDAVLTKPQLLAQMSAFEADLTAYKGGAADEPFVLLSLGSPVVPARAAAMTIGVIDFLGRKGMDDFAAQCLSAPVKLKRVTKLEDLLPLLSFGMADAVLVSKQQASYLMSTTTQKMSVTELPSARSGILVLGTRKGVRQVVGAETLRKLSVLGVETWR
jgi:hypothetical protein